MKSKDKTNKKKHESTIGKIIYGFLLFMPLLAIGVTCAYAIFNKNAYQSYSDTYVDTIKNVPLTNGIVEGVTYTATYREDTGNTPKIWYNEISIDWSDYGASSNYNYAGFYLTGNSVYLYETDTAPIQQLNIWGRTLNTFSFQANRSQNINANAPLFLSTITLETQKLDNVFYYSIDKVQQSPLFNWAEDSAIYTGMTATCNALNITTTFIPLLMTYWLIISIIYFLYDIILIILHVFHRKIHELEESI